MTLLKKTYAETKQIDTPYGRALNAAWTAEMAYKKDPTPENRRVAEERFRELLAAKDAVENRGKANGNR